jgi:hypothetical protein
MWLNCGTVIALTRQNAIMPQHRERQWGTSPFPFQPKESITMKKILSLTGILVLTVMTATATFALENGMGNHAGNTHQVAMTQASMQKASSETTSIRGDGHGMANYAHAGYHRNGHGGYDHGRGHGPYGHGDGRRR